ncbi:DNA-formamidopyrimidine glycosylase family protein, partial [Candidatus Poriferisodalis sp.]
MPEIPEIRAHAERLEALAAGEVLKRVEPLSFTALKTASPSPNDAVGWPLRSVSQRAKFLLLRFAPDAGDGLTFVVHLMQGGRLRVLEPGAKRPRRPRDGLARFEFESGLGLLLTEPGTQKRAGVWVIASDPAEAEPLARLGPEATEVDAAAMAELMAAHSARLHNFLR